MIRITYVTITYQAAKVLQRTLDSVLEQDYPEITHLIIDGASTDGTIEMVNDYIEQMAIMSVSSMPVTSYPLPTLPRASMVSVQHSTANPPLYYTAIQTSSMVRVVFCITVVSHRRKTSHGNRSVTACSSAIRLSMPVLTLLLPRLTIRNTAILPMLTGVSAL